MGLVHTNASITTILYEKWIWLASPHGLSRPTLSLHIVTMRCVGSLICAIKTNANVTKCCKNLHECVKSGARPSRSWTPKIVLVVLSMKVCKCYQLSFISLCFLKTLPFSLCSRVCVCISMCVFVFFNFVSLRVQVRVFKCIICILLCNSAFFLL